jgi:molybdopterin converting factor small subunit
MKVRILMFAAARDLCDRDTVELNLPDGARIRDLRTELVSALPQFQGILPYCRFAIDERYANDDDVVDSAAEIACIPPVSGG